MQRACLTSMTLVCMVLASACAPMQSEKAPVGQPPQAGAAAAEQQPDLGRIPVTGIEFPLVTHHRGVFNGKRVSYTATVAFLDIPDAEGKPGARIVSTSYVANAEPGAEPGAEPVSPRRPVMFVWNGGPISPSVYLHMGAFGPKRVAFANDLRSDPAAALLVDNPYSILDVADLVYFDPAGTGLSRTLPGKPLESYFSIVADAQQTAGFIAAWLKSNGRTESPAYIFGESYGTNRAVETAGQLAQLPEPILLDGVVLFGEAVNIIEYAQRPLNIMSYVVSLPTLAAIGWYHGKANTAETTLDAFIESAWQYAQGDYFDALFQGNTLPPERMLEVAERLEQFTGLSAEVFLEKRLRVSKEAYRVELFKAEGQVIGRSDGRYVGPAKTADGEAAPDPAEGLPRALEAAFRDYLVSELGLPSAEQYVNTSPVQGLDEWDWKDRTPFSQFAYGDALGVLLEKNPGARVLVAAGDFDTMTTIGASRYLVEQAAWPRERVTLRYYRGGHMAYSIEDSARDMAEDLRALVATGR